MFSFIPGYNNILFNLTKIPDRSPPIEGENYLSDDFIEILKQKCVVDSLDSDYLNLQDKIKKADEFFDSERNLTSDDYRKQKEIITALTFNFSSKIKLQDKTPRNFGGFNSL